MLRNYFKIAFRNLLRFKGYSLINIFGLAIGLSVGILILLFAMDEMKFDTFHVNGDRIYKIVTPAADGSMETNAWPVAYLLNNDYPEVEKVTYTRKAGPSMMVLSEGKRSEHNLFYADNEFLNIFTFPFIEGNPENALTAPYTIVLTESLRNRYFSGQSALGKSLILRDSLEFTVTGVIRDVPRRSHIQFEALLSFATYESLNPDFTYSEGWGNFNVRNYLLLREGTNIGDLSSKASSLYRENIGDWMDQMGVDLGVAFIPLNEIYLSDVYNGFGPQGSIQEIYLVAAIAVFVIILACINFINLSTARAVYRAREVGMRKIVGSSRSAIFWQFQIEVVLITLVSLCLVLLFIDFLLPVFNRLMDKSFNLSSLLEADLLIGIVIMFILISFLAGIYPSLVLSGFRPVEIMKARMNSGGKGINLRRTLVVLQFSISGALVLGTFIVIGQLKYMRSGDLGFNKEEVIVFDVTRLPNTGALQVFRNDLLAMSDVSGVSFANAVPGRPGWQGQWAYPGEAEASEGTQIDTEYIAIDELYLQVLDLELLAGRNFDPARPADLDDGVIINETTVREMGWETPENAIGKTIVSPSGYPEGTVIGVVKDYHGLGLQSQIWPKVMDYTSDRFGRYFAVRFKTERPSELIASVQQVWKRNFGDYSYEYFFLDQEFEKQYVSEERLVNILLIFAVLTVLIAAIGLLGLVSFMMVSKTREIGIRKILGADTAGLVRLMSREFVLLVIISNIIIIPLVWLLAKEWLNNFAYHMQIDPTIFLISMAIMTVVATLVVSIQTFLASRKNPVEIIRAD